MHIIRDEKYTDKLSQDEFSLVNRTGRDVIIPALNSIKNKENLGIPLLGLSGLLSDRKVNSKLSHADLKENMQVYYAAFASFSKEVPGAWNSFNDAIRRTPELTPMLTEEQLLNVGLLNFDHVTDAVSADFKVFKIFAENSDTLTRRRYRKQAEKKWRATQERFETEDVAKYKEYLRLKLNGLDALIGSFTPQ